MTSSKPPDGVHWFAWAFVTIAVACISTYGVIKASESKTAQSPSPTISVEASNPTAPSPTVSVGVNDSPTPSPMDLVQDNKADIISAIQKFNDAGIKAYRTLDTSSLYKVETGKSLEGEISRIQSLINKGWYEDYSLEDQQFQSFYVSLDGKYAEVKLIETWNYVVYSIATKACVMKNPSSVLTEAIYLVHTDSGWIVNNIAYTDNPASSPIPCQ